jgi:hypothetical protein
MERIKSFRLYGKDQYVVGTEIVSSKQLSYDYGKEIANAIVNFFTNKDNKNEDCGLFVGSDKELNCLEKKTK